jgi:hypothetical protein
VVQPPGIQVAVGYVAVFDNLLVEVVDKVVKGGEYRWSNWLLSHFFI